MRVNCLAGDDTPWRRGGGVPGRPSDKERMRALGGVTVVVGVVVGVAVARGHLGRGSGKRGSGREVLDQGSGGGEMVVLV